MIAIIFWLEFWRVLLQPPHERDRQPRLSARVVDLARWRRSHGRSRDRRGAA
jgi:hypothetical protein